ncbi:metalloregulator ArsR/SmtB family transcription factor [Azoarcus sp. TTM-91]|jgi:DNA-binding transcriptional ArsR family regulator|uniref:ArsR family transcriptional regulator n=1 Tax=Azoarcus indigens TaxID=29545 RepID=A0A4R6EH84_9RHOO|nr:MULTISPECIES: metalloregulator ArsR/SmtB family transcription factor [Azoarcus]NMG36042.1 metalloregulator ArsR/SmtB family transcription factor [Azoarcus sp. TTM-91]NMG66698.1 metalloregulator ArsR/SmtB family transcription factor [Azoarcus indigens]TDN56888.1 ArsR family transcriptional regulator [Azoarcus indigens]
MDIDEIIKALAHPVRRELLQWLKEPEKHFAEQEHPLEVGVCAGMFERCGLSQSTVSAHLATLQRAELVTTRRIGQWVFYKRNEDTIAEFLRRIGQEL